MITQYQCSVLHLGILYTLHIFHKPKYHGISKRKLIGHYQKKTKPLVTVNLHWKTGNGY